MSRGIESTSNDFAIGLAFLQEAEFKAKNILCLNRMLLSYWKGIKIHATDGQKISGFSFEFLVAVFNEVKCLPALVAFPSQVKKRLSISTNRL